MTSIASLTVPEFDPPAEATPEKMCLVGWLVEIGETVEAGDPYVQLAIEGVVFELNAPCSGVLQRKRISLGQIVKTGDLLGDLLLNQS